MTVGHGQKTRQELSDLLVSADVTHLVDVRRFPGSKRHPDMHRDLMPEWLGDVGIDYRWEENLGGRRRSAGPEIDTWWRVDAFRAYAGFTRTDDFRRGLATLMGLPPTAHAAVMCSESVWWRCHRRLIADVLVVEYGRAVRHLMPDGSLRDHEPAPGARLGPSGQIVWDGHTQE